MVAGGLVTSNDAGLSVPDWPLSYGKLMPKMEGGIFFEHGHRMVATTVGILTIILAIWLARAETRRWLRRLGWIALGAVIAQGLLGGMTVIFMLPKPVSISHACLAQLFFSTTVLIALFTSEEWLRERPMVEDAGAPSLHTLALAVPACVLAQLALGARGAAQGAGSIAARGGRGDRDGHDTLDSRSRVGPPFQSCAASPERPGFLSIATSQVFLGIAAYMSRIATIDAPQPMAVMVGFTVAHVAVGALDDGGERGAGSGSFPACAPPAWWRWRPVV